MRQLARDWAAVLYMEESEKISDRVVELAYHHVL